MNVKDKTKDDIWARKDLSTHCKRKRVNVQVVDEGDGSVREVVPPAPYVLTKAQRRMLCEWTRTLKFSDGYASNLGRCVDMKNALLHNMKSDDCHVFMQNLLPLAFRDTLPTNVWKVLIELSQFFWDLCVSRLHVDGVLHLEKNLAEILCKLERVSPLHFLMSFSTFPYAYLENWNLEDWFNIVGCVTMKGMMIGIQIMNAMSYTYWITFDWISGFFIT